MKCFLKFNVETNHLGILVKCRWRLGRAGVGPGRCVAHQLLRAAAADPWPTLSSEIVKDRSKVDKEGQVVREGVYSSALCEERMSEL